MPSVFTVRFILFGLVLAQLLDAMTFTVGVMRFGIHLESNGFATALFQTSGLGGVLAVKVGVILACLAILVATAEQYPRLLIWGGSVATSVGLLGFATNTASILILSA